VKLIRLLLSAFLLVLTLPSAIHAEDAPARVTIIYDAFGKPSSLERGWGYSKTSAGQTMPGHGGEIPMQVSSSGSGDLDQLVMFVLDPTKPFSSPAKFP
jgi:hypothetical protein